MKTLIILILFVFATFSSSAEKLLATDGKTRVLIDSEAACSQEISKLIKEEHREAFKAAEVVFRGSQRVACWAFEPNTGAIFVAFDDGLAIRVDPRLFETLPNL